MPFKLHNPKVATPLTQWVSLFNNNDVNSIVRLYETDAVLIPTFELIIFNQKDRTVYFTNLFKKENLKCTVIYNEYKQFPNGRSDVLIANGIYIFSFTENGKEQNQKARYTFVFNNGKIVSHHSSVDPE
jgi:hypothetical protein